MSALAANFVLLRWDADSWTLTGWGCVALGFVIASFARSDR